MYISGAGTRPGSELIDSIETGGAGRISNRNKLK
jgi:hypothetical protein